MKRFLVTAMALAAMQAMPVQAQDDAEAHYQTLLAAAKSGDAPVDWQALRFAYADRKDFDGQFDSPDRRAMFDAAARRDWPASLAAANRVLDKTYVDGMAHFSAGAADLALGHPDDAQREKAMAEGIFASIRTGDGLSFEHAFTVIAIDEEYDLLITMGVEPGTQGLVNNGDHTYDVFDTKDTNGKPVRYYFNIDHEWAAETRPFKALGSGGDGKQKGE